MIMYMRDRPRVLESDAVPKKGSRIENPGTSVKTTHTCGRLPTERKYSVELCGEYNPK